MLTALSQGRQYSERVLGHDRESSLQISSAITPLLVTALGKRGYDIASCIQIPGDSP
jgi:hypothetical protein